MREIAVLLVHCNGMKADNADAWALLPAENDMNVGIGVLPGLQSPRLQVAYIANNCPWCHSSASNARWMTANSTTQNGLTSARYLLLKELHCTFQRKSKQRTKCRSTKTCCCSKKRLQQSGVRDSNWTDGALKLKSPLHMNPLESVRGNRYICVSSMASHKSNLVQ
jgi:hypothetical protein